MVEGYWSTQTIRAAVQLNLPDILRDNAVAADEAARRAEAHAPSVERLLRAMVTLGLCEAEAGRRYRLTELGRLLRSDVEGSCQGRVNFVGRTLYPVFAELGEAVRTGRRAPSVKGEFESSSPAQVAVTQAAMAESSLIAAKAACEAYDFGRFSTILDVGGGFGGVIAYLLARFPDLRADVFDLPNVKKGAEAYLEKKGLEARARFISGNFTEGVPEGYDGYCLKYILHDWQDQKANAILMSCRRAMAPGATLVVLEMVVPERLEDSVAHRTIARGDMAMMTWGGKERTGDEYRRLLAEAGFELTRIVPTASVFSVIEAKPV
jgi:SAM-dependent methyltransferase